MPATTKSANKNPVVLSKKGDAFHRVMGPETAPLPAIPKKAKKKIPAPVEISTRNQDLDEEKETVDFDDDRTSDSDGPRRARGMSLVESPSSSRSVSPAPFSRSRSPSPKPANLRTDSPAPEESESTGPPTISPPFEGEIDLASLTEEQVRLLRRKLFPLVHTPIHSNVKAGPMKVAPLPSTDYSAWHTNSVDTFVSNSNCAAIAQEYVDRGRGIAKFIGDKATFTKELIKFASSQPPELTDASAKFYTAIRQVCTSDQSSSGIGQNILADIDDITDKIRYKGIATLLIVEYHHRLSAPERQADAIKLACKLPIDHPDLEDLTTYVTESKRVLTELEATGLQIAPDPTFPRALMRMITVTHLRAVDHPITYSVLTRFESRPEGEQTYANLTLDINSKLEFISKGNRSKGKNSLAPFASIPKRDQKRKRQTSHQPNQRKNGNGFGNKKAKVDRSGPPPSPCFCGVSHWMLRGGFCPDSKKNSRGVVYIENYVRPSTK